MKEIKYITREISKGSTGIFKDIDNHIFYLLKGQPHRSDGPAIETPHGTKVYYYYGTRACSEKEFYNSDWRKRIEIKNHM